MQNLRIISWNVNGIRAWQRKGLLEWFHSEQPDIFCVQETKAHPDQLDEALRQPDDYSVYWSSSIVKKGYSGVATYSKPVPERIAYGFGIDEFDQEGRIVETDFGAFTLLNIYFPKGTVGSPRLQYKMDFYTAFFKHCKKLRRKKKKLVICGDFNTAHKEIDLARPKANEKISGFLPEERARIDEMVAMGFVDAFREFSTEPGHYSWWSNRSGARERNVGWRLDYFMVTKDLMPAVTGASIMPEVLGSDHCPVVLELAVE